MLFDTAHDFDICMSSGALLHLTSNLSAMATSRGVVFEYRASGESFDVLWMLRVARDAVRNDRCVVEALRVALSHIFYHSFVQRLELPKAQMTLVTEFSE